MYCAHVGMDLDDFTTIVAPVTAHIHVGDAAGVSGEGLQIGDGEIDFETLSEALNSCDPNTSFIPEIWQGHKDGGEGFWDALERLKVSSKHVPFDRRHSGFGATRSGSKSIANKNLHAAWWSSILAYAITAGRLLKNISNVIVSTNDQKYVSVARGYGAGSYSSV